MLDTCHLIIRCKVNSTLKCKAADLSSEFRKGKVACEENRQEHTPKRFPKTFTQSRLIRREHASQTRFTCSDKNAPVACDVCKKGIE